MDARGAQRSPRAHPHPTTTPRQSRAEAAFTLLSAATFTLLLGCEPLAPDTRDIEEVADNNTATADLQFKVITFNIGTTDGLAHDRGEDDGTGDGYTQAMADITDAQYENSLSWNPAETALTNFLTAQRPAIVAFQAMFFGPCPTGEAIGGNSGRLS